MNEKTKRVLGFLLMKPAMSSRNLTSLGLVAMFFAVYVLAGGTVSPVPKVAVNQSFGTGVIEDRLPAPRADLAEEIEIAPLEQAPKIQRNEKASKASKRFSMFDSEEAVEEAPPIVKNNDSLDEAKAALDTLSADDLPEAPVEEDSDGLSSIEKRLKKLGK